MQIVPVLKEFSPTALGRMLHYSDYLNQQDILNVFIDYRLRTPGRCRGTKDL